MIDQLLQQFTERTPPAPLCPTQIWQRQISSQISMASDEILFGTQSGNDEQREMRLAVRAGLLLFNDDLEASHNISQHIQTSTGSFWHALMHRREGDFSNSKYWLDRTGDHPAMAAIYGEIHKSVKSGEDTEAIVFLGEMALTGTWQPEWFVESCEKAVRENREASWLQELQTAEMTALLNWCRERAN